MKNKYSRIRRHLAALLRYGTPYRLWNLGLVELERLFRKRKLWGRPYILVIDPLNMCNLRCPFCPTGQGTLPLKPGRMPLERFIQLVDRLAPHVIKLILYNWGEPFLHKDILSMIRYAHRKRIATVISSNLNVLPEEGGGEAIVQSGLDDLIVSCDGLTQETYEIYRKGGKLERVINNLRDVAEAKRTLKSRTPVIEFQFLVFRHNEHEVDQVEEFARHQGADFARLAKPYLNLSSQEIQPAQNPDFVRSQYLAEEVTSDPRLDIFSPDADPEACAALHPPPLQCYWPWRALVINWNGQVDPCCGKNYRMPFGNIFEQSFPVIWNGPAYTDARDWIAGRKAEKEWPNIVCRGCGGYK